MVNSLDQEERLKLTPSELNLIIEAIKKNKLELLAIIQSNRTIKRNKGNKYNK